MVAPRRDRAAAERHACGVDLRANKIATANILLAMRVKDLTYSADLPLSAS